VGMKAILGGVLGKIPIPTPAMMVDEGTKWQLITNEELEQQAASLEGATVPDGQKYEDWLKDREKSHQDE
jgi:hypothetical protein